MISENVRTEKRTYIKLIAILGDVGGLMEVVFTIFRVISPFSVDILYEISLVNNLFNFDLDKKIVILKDKTNDLPNNESPKTYTPTNIIKKVSQQNSIYMNEEMSMRTGKRMNSEGLLRVSFRFGFLLLFKPLRSGQPFVGGEDKASVFIPHGAGLR